MNEEQLKTVTAVTAKLGAVPHPRYSNGATVKSTFLMPDGVGLNDCVLSFRDPRGWGESDRLEIELHPDYNLSSKHRPWYRDGEEPKESMTVTVRKSAEQICKEIERKIVPGCKKHLAECLAVKAADDERNQAQIEGMTRLHAMVPGADLRSDQYRQPDADNPPAKIWKTLESGAQLEVEWRCGAPKIELCTDDLDLAEAVLALVSEREGVEA